MTIPPFCHVYLARRARIRSFIGNGCNLAIHDAPTFADNLKFMFSWQIYQMYGRYFLWNFAGRYNEQDGQQQMGGFHGYVDGDWTTGIFDKAKHLPKSVLHDNTYTPLYALPLILGLIGLVYHYRHSKRDALVVGLALVFYQASPL